MNNSKFPVWIILLCLLVNITIFSSCIWSSLVKLTSRFVCLCVYTHVCTRACMCVILFCFGCQSYASALKLTGKLFQLLEIHWYTLLTGILRWKCSSTWPYCLTNWPCCLLEVTLQFFSLHDCYVPVGFFFFN